MFNHVTNVETESKAKQKASISVYELVLDAPRSQPGTSAH